MTDFLADENLPLQIVQALRTLGHRVDVVDPVQRGAPDVGLLARADPQSLILLTQDKGIAKLALHDGHPCFGLVVLDVPQKGGWKRNARAQKLAQRIHALTRRLAGHVTIVSENGETSTPL